MKNKKIILSVISTTLATGTIVPLVTVLSSCKGDKNPVEEPKWQKLNMSSTVNADDFFSISTPVMMTNNCSRTANLDVTLNSDDTEVRQNFHLQYRKGVNNTTSCTFPDEWTDIPFGSSRARITTITKSDAIQFRAFYLTNPGIIPSSVEMKISVNMATVKPGEGIVLNGSMMSFLCDAAESAGVITVGNGYTSLEKNGSTTTFKNLFQQTMSNHSGLASVCPNFLPFKTLTPYCYENMFNANTGQQTEVQESPLVMAPDLPATNLAEGCYKGMFTNCNYLATAPLLPAIHLATDCYKEMFKNCSKLNAIQISYLGNFLSKYFTDWVSGVKSTGTMFYNGCDTQKSDSEIPTNFIVKQDATFIANSTYTVQITDDTDISSTATTVVTGKTKFRGLATDTWGNVKDQFPRITDLEGNEKNWQLYEGKGKKAEYTDEQLLVSVAPHLYAKNGDDVIVNYDYVNVTALEDSTITATLYNTGTSKKLEYSEDGENWHTIVDSTTKSGSVTVDKGKNFMLRGDMSATASGTTVKTNTIKIEGKAKLFGCPMQLIGKTKTTTSLGSLTYAFCRMFMGSTGLVEVDKDFLKNITDAPIGTYREMFSGCTNLAIGPEILPATSPKLGAYYGMFEDCKLLQKAPEIKATSLPSATGTTYPPGSTSNADYMGVCKKMFKGCLALNDATNTLKNIATIGNTGCESMFEGCTSLVTAPEFNDNVVFVDGKYAKYNNYWERLGSVTTSPCFNMFKGCTELKYAPSKINVKSKSSDDASVRDTGIPAIANFANMFYGCTKLETVPTMTISKLRTGITTSDTNITAPCFGMFEGCKSLINASNIKLTSTVLSNACYIYMFKDCRSLQIPPIIGLGTSAPEMIFSNATSYKINEWTLNSMFENTGIIVSKGGALSSDYNAFAFFTCWDYKSISTSYGYVTGGYKYEPTSIFAWAKETSTETQKPGFIGHPNVVSGYTHETFYYNIKKS